MSLRAAGSAWLRALKAPRASLAAAPVERGTHARAAAEPLLLLTDWLRDRIFLVYSTGARRRCRRRLRLVWDPRAHPRRAAHAQPLRLASALFVAPRR